MFNVAMTLQATKFAKRKPNPTPLWVNSRALDARSRTRGDAMNCQSPMEALAGTQGWENERTGNEEGGKRHSCHHAQYMSST